MGMKTRCYYLLFLAFLFWGKETSGQSLLKETRLDSLSVFFESGNAEVKNPEALLKRINKLEQSGSGKIILIGYTDSVGSIESNRGLASKRLRSVAAILKSSHVKQYAIDSINKNEKRGKEKLNDNQFRRVDILIYKVEPDFVLNKPIDLNIQFRVASDYVLAGSYESMRKLLFIMKSDDSLKIKLNGHVCCEPDQLLSLNRAKRVKSFLVQNGIDEKRITCFGFSNTVKLVEETSPQNQAINRRVEAVFIK